MEMSGHYLSASVRGTETLVPPRAKALAIGFVRAMPRHETQLLGMVLLDSLITGKCLFESRRIRLLHIVGVCAMAGCVASTI
jgi:hypothetical protein